MKNEKQSISQARCFTRRFLTAHLTILPPEHVFSWFFTSSLSTFARGLSFVTNFLSFSFSEFHLSMRYPPLHGSHFKTSHFLFYAAENRMSILESSSREWKTRKRFEFWWIFPLNSLLHLFCSLSLEFRTTVAVWSSVANYNMNNDFARRTCLRCPYISFSII